MQDQYKDVSITSNPQTQTDVLENEFNRQLKLKRQPDVLENEFNRQMKENSKKQQNLKELMTPQEFELYEKILKKIELQSQVDLELQAKINRLVSENKYLPPTFTNMLKYTFLKYPLGGTKRKRKRRSKRRHSLKN